MQGNSIVATTLSPGPSRERGGICVTAANEFACRMNGGSGQVKMATDATD